MATNIITGALGANASRKAASLQDRAAQTAADNALAQYQQTRGDLQPWITSGQSANSQLTSLLGLGGDSNAAGYGSLARNFSMEDFQQDPGYQFNLDEGMKALSRTSAASNGVLSGAATKAAMRFGQDYASGEYDNAYNRFTQNQNNLYNRLSGLSTTGQNTAVQTGTLGANATSQANDYRTSGAAARAAGVIGSANAWNTGINNASNKVQRLVLGAV